MIKIKCPRCKDGKTIVIDTAHNNADGETYRKKKCTICGYIFHTIEFEMETCNDESVKQTWKQRWHN